MLNSNKLKIIAIICMIIDHIGYFLKNEISFDTYYLLRAIGRIAMPIFLFLLIQGFFNTHNLKKYICRIGVAAITTEIIIKGLNFINITYCKSSNISPLLNYNILFSFLLILIALRLIDRKISKNKFIDILVRSIGIFVIIMTYIFIPIDYEIYGLIVGIIMYLTQKYMKSCNILLKVIVGSFVIPPLYILAARNIIGIFSVIAVVIICLYNGERGKKNKVISTIFYLIFPLQYLVLYSMALIF